MLNAKTTIFDFETLGAFLTATFEAKKRASPQFSLRAWAGKLGGENPGTLSQALRGRRSLARPQVLKFQNALKLTGTSARYFELLNWKQTLKTRSEKEFCDHLLALLRKRPPANSVSDREFAAISHWYHMVLNEMASLRGATGTPSFLKDRLFASLSSGVAEQALADLVHAGFLKLDGARFIRTGKGAIRIASGKANENIRRFHKQMMIMANEAMEKMPVERRTFRGVTVPLTRAGYLEACEIMERAHNEVLALQRDENADDVYHFASQLFPVTKPEAA